MTTPIVTTDPPETQAFLKNQADKAFRDALDPAKPTRTTVTIKGADLFPRALGRIQRQIAGAVDSAIREATWGPDPIDTHVGRRIRARRKLLGISQADLAKSAGITFQQVQKYEKGTNRISASRLFQFCWFLGVDPAFVFEGLPRNDAAQAEAADDRLIRESTQEPDVRELVGLFAAMNATQRLSILNVARVVSRAAMEPAA
jgi:transcriptional regulator with XRE-family HTH domain